MERVLEKENYIIQKPTDRIETEPTQLIVPKSCLWRELIRDYKGLVKEIREE